MLAVGGAPFALGSAGDRPWVVDAPSASGAATVRHFDLTASPPAEIAADQFALAASAAVLSLTHLSGARSEQRLVVPSADGSALVIADLLGKAAHAVAIAGADGPVVGARFIADSSLIAWTADQFLRVDLSASFAATVSPGAQLQGGALPDPLARASLDAASSRLAYLRADGAIGIVTWSAVGAPSLAATVLQTLLPVTTLAFSPDGSSIFVLSRERGVVAVFSSTTPFAELGTQALDQPVALAPVRDGPAAGAVLVGCRNGTVLLGPNGTLARVDQVDAGLGPVGAGAAGVAYVEGAFGLLGLAVGGPFPLPQTRLDGLGSAGGLLAGWSGRDLELGPLAGSGPWPKVATASAKIAAAALSPDGRFVAAITGTGPFALELLARADAPPPAPALPAPLTFSSAPLAAWSGSGLYAAHPSAGGWTLSRYTAGTFAEAAVAALPGPPTALWDSPDDSAVIAVGANATAQAWIAAWAHDGSAIAVAKLPYALSDPIALSPDGRQLLAHAPANSDPTSGRGLNAASVYRTGAHVSVAFDSHVDLSGVPGAATYLPDGSRIYATVPAANAVVAIE